MATRKVIAAAALSAAVVTGGAIGATLGTPGISGAQDDATTTAPADGERSTPDTTKDEKSGEHRGRRGGFGGGVALDTAAEVIGISEDDLRSALQDGKTLAEVAAEHGVERQALVDALVAAGEQRLEEAKAALPERIGEAVDRSFEGGLGGRGGGGRMFPMIGEGLDAAAELLGITTDELQDSLRDGTSMADLAEEKGIDRQALVDALTAAAKEAVAAKVADGSITQERADAITERLANTIDRVVDGEGRFPGGPGGPGGRGGPGGHGETDDSPTTDGEG